MISFTVACGRIPLSLKPFPLVICCALFRVWPKRSATKISWPHINRVTKRLLIIPWNQLGGLCAEVHYKRLSVTKFNDVGTFNPCTHLVRFVPPFPLRRTLFAILPTGVMYFPLPRFLTTPQRTQSSIGRIHWT